jgi:hypothetical protein
MQNLKAICASQTQRQQETEQIILNPREHLERSLALTYDREEESEPICPNPTS